MYCKFDKALSHIFHEQLFSHLITCFTTNNSLKQYVFFIRNINLFIWIMHHTNDFTWHVGCCCFFVEWFFFQHINKCHEGKQHLVLLMWFFFFFFIIHMHDKFVDTSSMQIDIALPHRLNPIYHAIMKYKEVGISPLDNHLVVVVFSFALAVKTSPENNDLRSVVT